MRHATDHNHPGMRLLCGRLVRGNARAAGVEVGGGGGRLRLRLPHQRALLRLHAPQDLQRGRCATGQVGLISESAAGASVQLQISHGVRVLIPWLVSLLTATHRRDLANAC